MREDTQKALAEFEVSTFGNRANIEKAEVILNADEKVLFVNPTNLTVSSANTRKKEMFPGVVFLTDKRFVFHYQIMGNYSTDTILLSEIHSINCSGNGLTGSHVEIHTLVKTYDMLVSYKRSIAQKIQQIFESAKNAYNSQSNGIADPQPDILSQIERMSELKNKGIITEEEFQSKKKELLSRL